LAYPFFWQEALYDSNFEGQTKNCYMIKKQLPPLLQLSPPANPEQSRTTTRWYGSPQKSKNNLNDSL